MRTVDLRVLLSCMFLLVPGVGLAAARGPSGYHIVKKSVLGGEGGWDYLTVDSKARRVYISRGTHVMVVDADSGALVGYFHNTNGLQGIPIVPNLDTAV